MVELIGRVIVGCPKLKHEDSKATCLEEMKFTGKRLDDGCINCPDFNGYLFDDDTLLCKISCGFDPEEETTMK